MYLSDWKNLIQHNIYHSNILTEPMVYQMCKDIELYIDDYVVECGLELTYETAIEIYRRLIHLFNISYDNDTMCDFKHEIYISVFYEANHLKIDDNMPIDSYTWLHILDHILKRGPFSCDEIQDVSTDLLNVYIKHNIPLSKQMAQDIGENIITMKKKAKFFF